MAIKRDIPIEDLVEDYPFTVSFLREKGIVCIVCGEPVWGTLEEVAKSKKFNDKEIDQLVGELNEKAAQDNDQEPKHPKKSFSKDIGKLDQDNT